AALDRNDESGAIVIHPAGNAQLLAEQIEMLANDRNRLRCVSLAARAMAEKWKPERAVSILDGLLIKSKRGAMMVKNHSGQVATGSPPAITRDPSLVAGQ